MVRKYEDHQENLTVLRGRLMMAAQIRLNIARPDRLMCQYDEFSENNHTNQVLKATLQLLQRVARSQANQRNIAELLFCFHGVDNVASSEIRWHLVTADRLNIRYKPILSMARLFIEGRSPDVVSGGSDGFALLFDMNELFESYVGSLARRVFSHEGLTVSLQGPQKHLAMHSDGVPAFQLRPDIVVSKAGSAEFIVDTKWKRLRENVTREGVTSADAYQMFAYSSKYSAADVVLLYPHHPELGEWKARRASYLLDTRTQPATEGARTICVSTIDLRDLGTIEDQLRKIFPTFSSS
jgi:5-methylcytosine-specific restriction enzyme subunit McrC